MHMDVKHKLILKIKLTVNIFYKLPVPNILFGSDWLKNYGENKLFYARGHEINSYTVKSFPKLLNKTAW